MPPHRPFSPPLVLRVLLCGGALLAGGLIAGCSSDSSVTTAPTQVKCQVTLAAADAAPIGADGGSRTLTVTTTAECPWDVTTATTWVSNFSPTSGQGNGTVGFRVAPNPLTTARDADIVVNDAHLRVAQQPAPCRYTLSPGTLAMGAAGGAATATATVGAVSGCGWTVTSSAPWIAIAPPGTGSGAGVVPFSIAANDDPAPRSATLDLGNERMIVTQAGATAGPAPCALVLTPSGQSIPAGGGPASTSIGAPAGCTWSASSTVPWATISGSASGSGPGVVGVLVAANGGAARTGTVTVGSQVFTLVQSAATPATCVYRVTSTTTSFADTGGAGAITVATSGTCTWTTVSDVAWITITSGTTGSGNGSAAFTVAANSGPSRTGTITIAGQAVQITQAAAPAPPPCTISVNPTAASVSDTGGTGTVAVAASAASCPWSTTSGAPWITVTSAASGTGDGTVAYLVAANTGTARTGTLTIGGQTVTITQAAAPPPPPPACTYGITPSSASVPFLGATGSIAVSAAAGCTWTATSATAWITVTGGASGAGAGNVTYLVLPNVGSARTGTVTVAGQTFTVTQAAVAPTCTYSIGPTSASLSGATTTGSVAVTAPGGCAWTAVSNDNWIVVTSGASGSGNGTVAFSVSGKAGKNTRTGTVTIATRTFTVTQKD